MVMVSLFKQLVLTQKLVSFSKQLVFNTKLVSFLSGVGRN